MPQSVSDFPACGRLTAASAPVDSRQSCLLTLHDIAIIIYCFSFDGSPPLMTWYVFVSIRHCMSIISEVKSELLPFASICPIPFHLANSTIDVCL